MQSALHRFPSRLGHRQYSFGNCRSVADTILLLHCSDVDIGAFGQVDVNAAGPIEGLDSM